MAFQWCSLKRDEYPPVNDWVRAWNGAAVKALFTWSYDPAKELPDDLKNGKWFDEAGREITGVTHWCFLEESLDQAPPPPTVTT